VSRRGEERGGEGEMNDRTERAEAIARPDGDPSLASQRPQDLHPSVPLLCQRTLACLTFRAFDASPLRPGSQVHTSDWLLHCGLLAITHMITAVVRGQRAACMGADLRSDCFCPPNPVVGRQTTGEGGARQTNLGESGGDGTLKPSFRGENLGWQGVTSAGRKLWSAASRSRASPGCLQ
jgi:hypothetical protein